MQRLTILLLLLASCSFISSQHKFSGEYSSQKGLILRIENNNFKIILHNAAQQSHLYSDILAEGTIRYLENSLIEFNSSEHPYDKIFGADVVFHKQESSNKDSIEVKFITPYTEDSVRIGLYMDNFKNTRFIYSQDKPSVLISNKNKRIGFDIEPFKAQPLVYDALFPKIYNLFSIDYEIPENTSLIEINMPELDNSTFQQYYIKSDYARIVHGDIIWKGEIFKKK